MNRRGDKTAEATYSTVERPLRRSLTLISAEGRDTMAEVLCPRNPWPSTGSNPRVPRRPLRKPTLLVQQTHGPDKKLRLHPMVLGLLEQASVALSLALRNLPGWKESGDL